jgi:hypothetical protein
VRLDPVQHDGVIIDQEEPDFFRFFLFHQI